MNSSSHYFKDKPIFGLDIGTSSIKVMQLENEGRQTHVRGYGATSYDPKAIKDGIVTDYKSLAGSIYEMFDKKLIGEINTRRVALSVPASRTYARTIRLPSIKDDELMEAVQLEAEQYIPVPLDDLYLDYTVIERTEKEVELLAVAAPRKLIDSYMLLVEMLGLEPITIDTTILSAGRLFQRKIDINDIPTVLIDFGNSSIDITIHDKTIIVTGTISGGGSEFTKLISQKLSITEDEAHIVKTKYGLSKSKKQTEIKEALQPRLDTLVKEIRRMIRYHEERSTSKKKIEQVITMGGGANMPGMSDFLTSTLRMPVRTCNPWQHLAIGKLKLPSDVEKSIYVTVAGLSLISPKELFT